MQLRKMLGSAVAAALLAVGGVVATAPQASAAEWTPMGETLCSNTTRCGISTPIRISPNHWSQGQSVTALVTGQKGKTIKIRAYAINWDEAGDNYTLGAVSGEVSVTLSNSPSLSYGDATVQVPINAFKAPYTGLSVVIQPSDYVPGAALVPSFLPHDDPQVDEFEVRTDRAADMGFSESSSADGIFHRKAEAGIQGHKYSVQMLRNGKWVTIDNAGPGTVSSYGTVSIQARVPDGLPTGRYRTRLVNVTKGITDISPDHAYTYFTWTDTPSSPTDPGFDVYTTPGLWDYNGRKWRTTCEPYSQTERCRTEILATQITYKGGQFYKQNAYVFNNLTYKPSSRSLWKTNPLGGNAQVGYNSTWTKDGRQWRTECDTAQTGRNGCRSWTMTSVAEEYKSGGRTLYRVVNKWVFNNIVKFG